MIWKRGRLKAEPKKNYILSEQVKKSYLQTTIGVAGTVINYIILSLILWPKVETKTIIGWVTLVNSISLCRWGLKCWFFKRQRSEDEILVAKKWFLFMVFCSGAAWEVPLFFCFLRMRFPIRFSLHLFWEGWWPVPWAHFPFFWKHFWCSVCRHAAADYSIFICRRGYPFFHGHHALAFLVPDVAGREAIQPDYGNIHCLAI